MSKDKGKPPAPCPGCHGSKVETVWVPGRVTLKGREPGKTVTRRCTRC